MNMKPSEHKFEVVRAWRRAEAQGETQQSFARRMGIPARTLRHWAASLQPRPPAPGRIIEVLEDTLETLQVMLEATRAALEVATDGSQSHPDRRACGLPGGQSPGITKLEAVAGTEESEDMEGWSDSDGPDVPEDEASEAIATDEPEHPADTDNVQLLRMLHELVRERPPIAKASDAEDRESDRAGITGKPAGSTKPADQEAATEASAFSWD